MRGADQPIRCYVINLDRSGERLKHFTRNAMDQGLEFTRIPAVDGWGIGIDLQEKLLKKSCGLLPIGPGEMGCFLSHRKAWKEILDQDEDWAFVSEDDVHFCDASEFFRNSRWIQPMLC